MCVCCFTHAFTCRSYLSSLKATTCLTASFSRIYTSYFRSIYKTDKYVKWTAFTHPKLVIAHGNCHMGCFVNLLTRLGHHNKKLDVAVIYTYIYIYSRGAAPPGHPASWRAVPPGPPAPWGLRPQTSASQGAAPPEPPARADGRADGRGTQFIHIVFSRFSPYKCKSENPRCYPGHFKM